jgi:glyoxylase-like metal-dependent hydrolase (beta-lactamase superfamily II)
MVIHTETNDAVLIDPAWEPEKIRKIIDHHQAKLKAILLTHHHFDHVNQADVFAHSYDIPVLMSMIEINYYHFSCYNLFPIENSDTLFFGQLKIIPLLTPGHTKGAISYLIEDALFTGDTLFIEGCGICTGRGSDPITMFNTLSYLKEIISSRTKIYPGHSFGQEPGKSFSYLLKNNIYLQFNKQEEFVAFRMRKNQKEIFSFK